MTGKPAGTSAAHGPGGTAAPSTPATWQPAAAVTQGRVDGRRRAARAHGVRRALTPPHREIRHRGSGRKHGSTRPVLLAPAELGRRMAGRSRTGRLVETVPGRLTGQRHRWPRPRVAQCGGRPTGGVTFTVQRQRRRPILPPAHPQIQVPLLPTP